MCKCGHSLWDHVHHYDYLGDKCDLCGCKGYEYAASDRREPREKK